MSLLTEWRAPGAGRRQADHCERLAGEAARLRSRLRTMERALAAEQAAHRATARELGETVHALMAEREARGQAEQLLTAALDVNARVAASRRPIPAAVREAA
jgi:hypothetical protein